MPFQQSNRPAHAQNGAASPGVDMEAGSKWAHTPSAPQLSANGGAPIRSRAACVQRSSSAAVQVRPCPTRSPDLQNSGSVLVATALFLQSSARQGQTHDNNGISCCAGMGWESCALMQSHA